MLEFVAVVGFSEVLRFYAICIDRRDGCYIIFFHDDSDVYQKCIHSGVDADSISLTSF